MVAVEHLERGELRIAIDPKYRAQPSIMDHDGSASLIGLGSFVESLSLAAEFDQYNLQIQELGSDKSFFDFFARVQITQAPSSHPCRPFISSSQSIINRVTNRTPFLKTPVPLEFQAWMQAEAQQFGLLVRDLSDLKYRSDLIKVLSQLEKVRWENKLFLAHLLDELKEDLDTQDNTGIPVHQLGLNQWEQMALVALKKWVPIRELMRRVGSSVIAKGAISTFSDPLPFFCYLVAPTTTAESFFNIGRCLQRIWLVAHEKGLALQPLANHLIAYQSLNAQQPFGLTINHQKTIAEARQIYQTEFGIDLLKPIFGFRLGYPSRVVESSYRRSFNQIMST